MTRFTGMGTAKVTSSPVQWTSNQHCADWCVVK